MITQKYYEILGININSSKTDIKKAYRQLAKKYHPDLNKAPDAREKFIEIQNAYEKILALSPVIHTYSPFKTSDPGLDEIFEEIFNPNSDTNKKMKKERERPRPISEVLNHLIEDIDQYCREILDEYFVETNPKYKKTIKDWNHDFEGLKELKKEIYKTSWQYDLEDDGSCMGDDENCHWTEEMGEDGRKLCKKCFEETKKRWRNSYKRAIDIGFVYLRAYLETTPKYYKLLREEYNSKKERIIEKKITDYL